MGHGKYTDVGSNLIEMTVVADREQLAPAARFLVARFLAHYGLEIATQGAASIAAEEAKALRQQVRVLRDERDAAQQQVANYKFHLDLISGAEAAEIWMQRRKIDDLERQLQAERNYSNTPVPFVPVDLPCTCVAGCTR